MSGYEAYLASPHWRATRMRILERAEGRCEKCRKRDATQIHHFTYERLGRELDGDLIAVCFFCHKRFHRGEEWARSKNVRRNPVWSARAEWDCPVCPSMVAERVHADGVVRQFCVCGHSQILTLADVLTVDTQVERRGDSSYTPCPDCDGLFVGESGLADHIAAVH